MFKKIEIWVLYLVLVLVFISYIIIGAMIRREVLLQEVWETTADIPIITPLSQIALFLAEIPANLSIALAPTSDKLLGRTDRFPGISGFPDKAGWTPEGISIRGKHWRQNYFAAGSAVPACSNK